MSAIRQLLVFCFLLVTVSIAHASETLRLYIGTAESGDGKGIYVADFDTESGAISNLRLAASANRPSFLWLNTKADTLYSVSEVRRKGTRQGAAAVAWKVDSETGLLTERNRQDAMGDGPCFVTMSPETKAGQFVAIANYGSGSTTVFPVNKDGSLAEPSGHVQHEGSGPDKGRQAGPHAHSVRFDATGSRLLAADLGIDKVLVFDLGPNGSISPSVPPAIQCAPGSGPRHFVLDHAVANRPMAFVLGELAGTITVAEFDPPRVRVIQSVTTRRPGDSKDNKSSEILIHPNGKFLYAANRGPDEIAAFRIQRDAKEEVLVPLGHYPCGGQVPRNFRLSPDGKFLLVANQRSNNIAVLRVEEDGSLLNTEHAAVVTTPMCLKFWK